MLPRHLHTSMGIPSGPIALPHFDLRFLNPLHKVHVEVIERDIQLNGRALTVFAEEFQDVFLSNLPDLKVRTVDGTSELRIPPGTQPGDVIVLAKQGVPSLNRPSIRGDHLFTVKVTIPKRISGRERELLEELASLSDGGFARRAPKPKPAKLKSMHQEKEVGASQEDNDKPNEEEGNWLKKLTDFAGSIANGAAKWLKDNL